jgi:hypothetical protein
VYAHKDLKALGLTKQNRTRNIHHRGLLKIIVQLRIINQKHTQARKIIKLKISHLLNRTRRAVLITLEQNTKQIHQEVQVKHIHPLQRKEAVVKVIHQNEVLAVPANHILLLPAQEVNHILDHHQAEDLVQKVTQAEVQVLADLVVQAEAEVQAAGAEDNENTYSINNSFFSNEYYCAKL